ncbi:MAG: peptidylprolyl isomerase [Pirellulales bacterium]|nr:peptidylprolyl isomerase [Pirellulales bacterium]
MYHPYRVQRLFVAGLLLATILWPLAATADSYSGLTDPRTEAYGSTGMPAPTGVASPNHLLGPSSVPATPETPTPTTRPAAWPGQMPQYPTTGYAPAAAAGALQSNRAVPIETRSCEDAKIMARVGTEIILAGDLWAVFVNKAIEDLDEPPPEKYREKILKSALPHAIVTKLLYVEAKRSIPDENFPQVEKQIDKYFYRDALPKLMKRAKVSSRDELEQKLADLGTTLQLQRQLFLETALGQQWMATEIKSDEPINPDELYAYYNAHATDYDHAARARWEELMTKFSESPSEEAAHQRLSQLGNQVIKGLPFAEVARRGSDGPTATDGGARDWTTRGSLVSEQLDQALFELPVGQLSPILRSDLGLHIVRVVEREDAHRTPFTDVQDDIRKTIQDERWQEQSTAYLARLKDTTPVWTVYDEPASLAEKRPADALPNR